MGHAGSCKLVLMSWSVAGDVSVGIKCDARVLSEDEEDVDFDIIHNANDTFTVKYVPPAAGRYTIKVLFASQVCGARFFPATHTQGEGVFRAFLRGFSLWFIKIKKGRGKKPKLKFYHFLTKVRQCIQCGSKQGSEKKSVCYKPSSPF